VPDPTYCCPKCSKTFTAPASLEGRTTECPRCGREVVGWPAPVSVPAKAARADAREADASKAEWSSRNRVSQIVCMVLAAFCATEAFNVPAIQAATWAGLACCAAILARMAQAEAHYEGK
jgi:hypothetical protein